MKPKTLLLLALAVGALAAAVLLFEKDLPSTDDRTARAKKIVSVESDELVELEVEWQGERARFARDAKSSTPSSPDAPARKWRMLEPFATAADSALVDALAGQLVALELSRELEGVARADVGLEPPRGKLTWKTATAAGVLEIGGEVPASSTVVVAASTRQAPAVVNDAFVTQLERAPGDWRSREAVPAPRGEIERVTVLAPGAPPIVLVKSGETLRLEAPVSDVAEREAVDALLSELSGMRIETFLDAPLTDNARTALASPAGTIELALAGRSEPFRIVIGGEPLPGKRTVQAGEQAFVGATKIMDSVLRSASDWRSRHWTRFENWRVERVTVEDAAGRMVLERKDGQWQRDGVEIGFSVASDLLYALSSARAESIREGDAEAAAQKPALTLTLADGDGNEETLTLGTAEGTGTPARVSGRDLTLILAAPAAEEVRSKLGALRAAAPVTPPAAPARPQGNATPVQPG